MEAEVELLYNVREGKLKRTLELAYEYSNPAGKYTVVLRHPNMKITVYTDSLDWLHEVVEGEPVILVESNGQLNPD